MKRDNRITIAKALGIIMVVVGHTDGLHLLNTFIYEFHMPLFFICAGYFFSLKYLTHEGTFVGRRLKGLYVPFVKWSLFFLLIHNLMFRIGILNEQYGNWSGGVTHPYNWQQIQQRLWNILFSMGGYDEFLAGAFWFFRGLFVASILYLLLYKVGVLLASRFSHYDVKGMERHGKLFRRTKMSSIIGAGICVVLFGLCVWKAAAGLKIVTLVQGGSRDLMGCFFFGIGFLIKPVLNKFREIIAEKTFRIIAVDVVLFAVVLLFAIYDSSAMVFNPDLRRVLALPIPAFCGFLLTYDISCRLDTIKDKSILKRFLIYCGNNTLIIFILHICAYKIVSVLKIMYYGLPWDEIGCHMTIHEHADDLFWILYTIAGVGVPLLLQYGYDTIKVKSKKVKYKN